MSPSPAVRGVRLLASVAVIAVITVVAFESHAKSFVAGFLYLFPLMVIAFRWGFLEAGVASVFAVGCLDYFFTLPLLHFYMDDPQDWIALICFEATFLVTSGLAARIKRYAADAVEQQRRIGILYRISREILHFDRQQAIGARLVELIHEVLRVDGVSLWDAGEGRLNTAGDNCIPEDEVRGAWFHRRGGDDLEHGQFTRVLLIGVRAIGSLGMVNGPRASAVDSRMVDAVASLSAVALERSHSFLAESNAEAARQTEHLRSTVLDGLAHALKTPLATIQTASSGLLEMGGLGPAQIELASLINQESLRLKDLTNQALQTAKADRSQVAPRREFIPVATFLRSFREECKKDFAGHTVRCLSDAGGASVWADPGLLQMALLQLVDNAAKYGSPAAPITVRAGRSDAEIVFSVSNEGSYIVPEERLRIFQRYYRSPGAEYRAPGTGIGLSIVRRAAEIHGGRVWTESEPETGTIFYLGVPLREQVFGRAAG